MRPSVILVQILKMAWKQASATANLMLMAAVVTDAKMGSGTSMKIVQMVVKVK